MMISKPGGIPPFQIPRAQTEPGAERISRSGQYDRVELTANKGTDEERFAKELASRISTEVRTAKSEELPQIKEQVQSGTYHYSIDELAVQILLMGGPNHG